MNSKIANSIMLWLITAVTLFHISIILKVVPYDITWGGRLKSDAEMYMFESLSIMINLFLIFILLIKGHYVSQVLSQKAVNVILWVFLVVFGLNTIGNLLANTIFEKSFAVVTLACSVLIWFILHPKNSTHPTMYKQR